MSLHLLHDSETPTLRFDSHQDALDFAAKIVQDSKDWLARNDRNFIDRYKRVEIEIVVPCCSSNDNGTEPQNYHLIFRAIPNMRIRHRERSAIPPSGSSTAPHDGSHRCNEFVFLPITQFIECLQEVIPSTVRLESAKERLNLFREMGRAPNGASHLGKVTSEGERGVFGFGWVNCKSDGVPCVVQAFPQIPNQIADDVGNLWRERLNHLDLMDLPSRLRIGFDNLCIWIVIHPLADAPMEVGKEIFLSPCEFAA